MGTVKKYTEQVVIMETRAGDRALRKIAEEFGMAISVVAREALRLGLPQVKAEFARRGEQPVAVAAAAPAKQGVSAVIPAKPVKKAAKTAKAAKAAPALVPAAVKRAGRPRKSTGGIPQAQFQAPPATSSAV